MSDARERELEDALEELEGLARPTGESRRPDRYDARALLIPLGAALRDEGDAAAQRWLARARAACDALGEAWENAVHSELALACAEHVHAVDRRYLELPNYDFEYTCKARERLEARLVAARALGHEVPESLVQGVVRADRILAPFLAERGAKLK